jgi:hypothetical protein
MKIKFRLPILGMFHNDPNGVQVGQVVDVEEFHARRYVRNEWAEPVDEGGKHF